MEPVLRIIVNIWNCGSEFINLRGDRSHDHLCANLSTENGEDVMPVMLLQPGERRRSPNIKPIQSWKFSNSHVLPCVEGSSTHHGKGRWGIGEFVLGRRE
jgi:hypothetical protein